MKKFIAIAALVILSALAVSSTAEACRRGGGRRGGGCCESCSHRERHRSRGCREVHSCRTVCRTSTASIATDPGLADGS